MAFKHPQKNWKKHERVMFRLDWDMHDRLKTMAAFESKEISQLLREILDQGLALKEKHYSYYAFVVKDQLKIPSAAFAYERAADVFKMSAPLAEVEEES